ncbi:MAG: molybdate ABC transporter substrate-binding protein [Bacteroidales bacterium]|nr:molybdate ABC transporter substrate-binding protein [Bacteroidales bacterium]MBN2758626.1 molybdate ABC transporter substrate-binding protein [Bacteroidales bacterium]
MNQLVKIIFVILLMFFSFSCNSHNKNENLKIAVASNLRFAIEEINSEFEKQTGKSVEIISASSGKLTAQITNGAPFDIFVSANKKYAQKLFDEGFSKENPEILCNGVLVLWSNSAIEPELNELTQNSDLKAIAIANPQNAPYGIAAVEVLKATNIYDSIQSKLIFAESVLQLNQYIVNKAAQVGFTSKSIVLSNKLKNVGKWTEIDENLYSPIEQFVLLLNENSNSAKVYKQFLFSDKSKSILIKYGYLVDN